MTRFRVLLAVATAGSILAVATAYQASGGPFDSAPELAWPAPPCPATGSTRSGSAASRSA